MVRSQSRGSHWLPLYDWQTATVWVQIFACVRACVCVLHNILCNIFSHYVSFFIFLKQSIIIFYLFRNYLKKINIFLTSFFQNERCLCLVLTHISICKSVKTTKKTCLGSPKTALLNSRQTLFSFQVFEDDLKVHNRMGCIQSVLRPRCPSKLKAMLKQHVLF